MGCCFSNDAYEIPFKKNTDMLIDGEILLENSRYIPYHHLQQKPKPSLTMNDPKILSLQHQLDQHKKLLTYQTHIPLQVRTCIEKIIYYMLTNNSMGILNTWGIVFEYEYQPIWILKVAPTDKIHETRLVLLIDLDSIINASWGFQGNSFLAAPRKSFS